MVEHYLAKVGIRVRFSVPAQYKIAPKGAILYCAGKQEHGDALVRESKCRSLITPQNGIVIFLYTNIVMNALSWQCSEHPVSVGTRCDSKTPACFYSLRKRVRKYVCRKKHKGIVAKPTS